MSSKSTNLQRSAEGSPDGKAAVLEERPTGVATAVPRRAEKKVRARVITHTPPAPPASAADDVEAMYIEHRSLLLYVAARKFRIPECDSENLIHEVFISFLQTGTKINDVRAGTRGVAARRLRRPAGSRRPGTRRQIRDADDRPPGAAVPPAEMPRDPLAPLLRRPLRRG